jgi:uncharacterized protein YjiS (DUF1127 family)
MNSFKRFAARVSEGFRASRYHQAFSQMSDRQLADIGLSRETISNRARELARLG